MSQVESQLDASGTVSSQAAEWFFTLPGMPALRAKVGRRELRRRLLHMVPGVIPIGLPFTPHSDVWEPLLMTAAIVFCASGLIAAIVMAPQVKRRGEQNWTQAVWGYILPPFAALLLFPARADLVLLRLQIIAFGAGSATLGGKFFGGSRLPWNTQKTWSGLLCFVLMGSLAATYSYWGEARPSPPIGQAYLICLIAALCAALVESLPSRMNDNFRVGMTALTVGFALSSLMQATA